MTEQPVPEAVALVALNQGLHPHAEPLVCDDLRGHHSLFGESAHVPRPREDWTPPAGAGATQARRAEPWSGSLVLWADRETLTLCERARRICGGSGTSVLDVPALTLVAGESVSSFALAWSLVQAGVLPEWGAVLCSCQKEGRGQLRRRWHSPRGNLYVSFRLPDDPLLRGDAASLVTGYIVLLALRGLGFPLQLKWPNDLVLDGQRKVGGILLEEKDGVLVAGLGINLSQIPSEAEMRQQYALKPAVLLPSHAEPPLSLSPGDGETAAAEEPLAPFALWRRLVSEAILAHARQVRGRDLPAIMRDLDRLLVWKGRTVGMREHDRVTSRGVLLGLGPAGGALIRSDRADEEKFSGSLFLIP